MNKERLDLLTKDYLLKLFLINFVPGMILYFGITKLISISTGDGFLSLIIICSFAWTLGLVQEMVFFNSHYKTKKTLAIELGTDFQYHLLIAKVGSALVIACLLSLFAFIIDVVDSNGRYDSDILKRTFFKTSLVFFIGIFLVIKFRIRLKKLIRI